MEDPPKVIFLIFRLLLSIKKRTIASVTPLILVGILKDLQHVEIFHGGLPVTLAASVLRQIPQADRWRRTGRRWWRGVLSKYPALRVPHRLCAPLRGALACDG